MIKQNKEITTGSNTQNQTAIAGFYLALTGLIGLLVTNGYLYFSHTMNGLQFFPWALIELFGLVLSVIGLFSNKKWWAVGGIIFSILFVLIPLAVILYALSIPGA